MKYRQLTQEQRYQIYAFMKAGFNHKQIAAEIRVHPSTIGRELKRNCGERGYRPKQAQQKSDERKQIRHKPRIALATWARVETHLSEQWSPEQISGYLKLREQPSVSAERIYQHIWTDKKHGGSLYQHLRCQKQRRKRYGRNSKRGQIPNRRSIMERPEIVANKSRIGDWELDTIIGKRHQQAIVSVVDRKSKYCLLQKVERKTAAEVRAATCRLLTPVKEQVYTITSDNGREFAEHEKIASALSADFYFANPFHSWERGVNENTNGLVRQYFPKKTDLATVTHAQVQGVQERLNNRPRKTLGYRTPNELFFKEQKIALTT